MYKGILIFVLYTIIVSTGLRGVLVFAEIDKPAVLCNNEFHRIAVITTVSRDEIHDTFKKLQKYLLPDSFRLYEVKDETEAQQDKFCCTLFLNYQKRTTKTMWMIRRTATDDRIEIKLIPKDKHCSSNWEHISEEGYRRPGPSSNSIDYVGQLAISKIPKMEISCEECKVSVVLSAESLIDALKDKDEDREVRRISADTLGTIGDIKAVVPLINALKEEDAGVRWRAANALRQIKDIRAVKPLIDALKDEHSGVRYNAAIALRAIQLTTTTVEEEYFGEDPVKWQEWWDKNKKK